MKNYSPNLGPTVKKLRLLKEQSQEKFAAHLDITRSALAAYESGRVNIDRELLQKIANYCNVTIEEMIKDAEENESVLSELEPLRYKRGPKTNTNPELEGVTFVPIKALTGYGKKIVDPMFKSSLQKIFIPGMPYRGENFRIWEVEGNSMEPTFKEGYFVLTEKVDAPWNNIKEHHAYVVVTEEDVFLKRLAKSTTKPDHWVMVSDNETLYPQFLLPIHLVKELWFVKRKMDWEMSPPKRFDISL